MRIVAGTYGGRKLQVPKGRDIRPTSDKVRGAIFNALQAQGAIEGTHVLDAFCGTGALGLEALSRGAAHCTFIDKDRTSLALAKANAQDLGASDMSRFILRDSTRINEPETPHHYDLVFLDPPYRKDIISISLEQLNKNMWIKNGAAIVLEAEKEHAPISLPEFSPLSHKIYGDTAVMILRYNSAS